tara:strand:- start:183 stop:725 length:543 start_codon:yes stop_codon:yes gene_type:complete
VVRLLFIAFCILLHTHTAHADTKPLATEEEVPAALKAFEKWTGAFLAKDYKTQRAMTHPRIIRWYDKNRWKKLRNNSKQNGDIVSVKVEKAVSIAPEKIPCTEQGHCYRKNIPVLMFLLQTEYTKNTPPQPEYVVMARSDKGWLFGGGTFPNRPMGETLLIMNQKDVDKYTFRANNGFPR